MRKKLIAYLFLIFSLGSLVSNEIIIKESDDSGFVLEVKMENSDENKTYKLDDFNFTMFSISDVEIEEDDNQLNLKYIENHGNEYITTLHVFREYLLYEIAVIENRNGFYIEYKLFKNKIYLDDYLKYNDVDYESYEIFSFSGYQEMLEPDSSSYYEKIEKIKKSGEALELEIWTNPAVKKLLY